jgi:hypothetical protein
MPALRIFDAVCQRSFLAQGYRNELERVFAMLPGL